MHTTKHVFTGLSKKYKFLCLRGFTLKKGKGRAVYIDGSRAVYSISLSFRGPQMKRLLLIEKA